ncbi:MAG: PucR family transcriptional regulator [Pseudomonadota bacterium]
MTKVITRFFDSAEHLGSVRKELTFELKFPSRIVSVFDQADGMADALIAANVHPETGKAYEARASNGGGVLMVRAGFQPLGVARMARERLAARGAVDMGDLVEEVEVREAPEARSSILSDHPLLLSRVRDPESTNYFQAEWLLPLLIRDRKTIPSGISSDAHMAEVFLPLTIRRKPFDRSVFPRHARMANFPIPLTNRRVPYSKSAFPRHARMANFPIPLLSKRKPYTRSLIARHARMANWPFPHLINGKIHTNSLMPGAPRMANFPISLLSKRKPYTGSIIPKHGRMANFPIPLTNRRVPYSKSAFPRHARMANWPIPLVISHGEAEAVEPKRGFSFSKFLGLRTVIRR